MRKRNKCDICDFKSTSTVVIKKHTESMHKNIKMQNIKSIICDQCDKRFNKKETFNQHKKKVHGVKQVE